MSVPVGDLTRVPVSVSAAGDNVLVAGAPGQQIAVFEFVFIAASGVTATLKSGTGGTAQALTGPLPLGGTSTPGLGGNYNPAAHFTTNQGEALNLNLSSAVAVTGWLIYARF